MASKQDKGSFFARFARFWVRLVLGIGRAFKNTFYELKKVTWPTKHSMINYSILTFGFMALMGVVIFLIDLGSAKLVELLVSIG